MQLPPQDATQPGADLPTTGSQPYQPPPGASSYDDAAGPVFPPPAQSPDNVVYLHGQGGVSPNPHAADYQYGVHAPPAGQGGGFTTNVLGEQVPIDFFADTPSARMFEEDREPRVVGTMLALGAIGLMLTAFAVYGLALRDGTGGALAGGFVLLGSLLWVWYISLPREQQHAFLMRRHRRIAALVDRRVLPMRRRTETRRLARRERDRYRAMRDERSRRVVELGELAYRSFRTGALDHGLVPHAQRVMAIEQQMLMQDKRLHEIDDEER